MAATTESAEENGEEEMRNVRELSPEEFARTILKTSEDPFEVVKVFMDVYAENGYSETIKLIGYILNLAADMAFSLKKKNLEYDRAISLALLLDSMHQAKTKDHKLVFACYADIMKTVFPNGYDSSKSSVELEQYRTFHRLLHYKRAYDPERDAEWAKSCGLTDYLDMVYKQEIPDDER